MYAGCLLALPAFDAVEFCSEPLTTDTGAAEVCALFSCRRHASYALYVEWGLRVSYV